MYRFHTKSFCIVTIWHQTLSYRIFLETVHNVTFSHQIIEEKCLSLKELKAEQHMAKFLVRESRFYTSDSLIFMYLFHLNLTCSKMLLNIVYRRIYRFRNQFKFIIYIYKIFTFRHQVLQNKTFRLRTKKYQTPFLFYRFWN